MKPITNAALGSPSAKDGRAAVPGINLAKWLFPVAKLKECKTLVQWRYNGQHERVDERDITMRKRNKGR